MGIIGTRIKEGQGLGNRLFVYISVRAIAKKLGMDFAILDSEILERGLRDKDGNSFLTLDYGKESKDTDWTATYDEKSNRLFVGNSKHDIINGVDVSEADEKIFELKSGTLIEGILQSPYYFKEYKKDIKDWLKVKPEFDSHEYTADDLCIINIRGGEYADSPELFLRRKYWLDAMKNMRAINPDMRFMVITDDVDSAKRILPEVEAHHFEVWKDYVTVKNARYLILSNSSFAFFPAYTSETAQFIIAPKYWARHNVSDGYWCAEQNIYDEFVYQDRKGRLFSAEECKTELKQYMLNTKMKTRINEQLYGTKFFLAGVRGLFVRMSFWISRIILSIKKRIRL